VSHSPEARANRLPDMESFVQFAKTGLAVYGGKTKFLDAFGLLRGSSSNQDVPKAEFADKDGLWKEWEGYRLKQVSPEDKGYLQLLQDGEDVVPGLLVAMPEDEAGKPWQKGACTVLVNLHEKSNSAQRASVRLGYDNEDIPPYLALATLALCGYEMDANITARIQKFSKSFAETGTDFYNEAMRLTRNVRYRSMHLDSLDIEQFVSENRHRFYNEQELGL
jgi:hypothetical protein